MPEIRAFPLNDKGGIFMFKPESWQSHNEYRTFVDTFSCNITATIPITTLTFILKSTKNF